MKINNKVYALDSTKGNYAYIIQDKEIVLIDTGRPGQGKNILNELKSMNINPEDIKHILITHYDIDHVGNVALLETATNATIWASKEEIPYILGDKSLHGIKKYLSYIMRVKKPENIKSYPDDQKIGEIEVIPTPGHTPGHVCLLFEDVLFVGDLVRSSKGKIKPMRTMLNWDESVLKESIKKMDNYSFNWVCTAHGEPIMRNNIKIDI